MPNTDRPIDNDTNKTRSHNTSFVGSGFLLFLTTMIVSMGGWAFWLIIPRLTTTTEIGNATTVYSLTLFAGTLVQLGLEYPLLIRSLNDRSKILGTVLIIELAITGISLPFIFIIMEYSYEGVASLFWFAVALMIFSSISFVSRYALLGFSDARIILIFNAIGTAIKFAVGVLLLSLGYGSFGILLAFAMQSLVIAGGTLFATKKYFALAFGGIKFSKQIISEGLVNLPSKLSSVFILSLGVVLLASFGVQSADIGIFYILTMISTVVGGFASSTAIMSIPAASVSKTDLSFVSERIGLVFTAPLIILLVIAPELILAIIGEDYILGGPALVILAIAVFPSVIVRNAISKFNSQGKHKRLLGLGLLQCISFIIPFFILVPQYGILGAAYSVLISSASSAFLSLIWSEGKSTRYILLTGLIILTGSGVGLILTYIFNSLILSITISLASTFSLIFGLKCTSVRELRAIIRTVL